MPTVDFSSDFWQEQFNSGEERCGDDTGAPGYVDPDTGAMILIHRGVLKMGLTAGIFNLGVVAHSCNAFNPSSIPRVECRILLPRLFAFVRFRFDLDFPGTIRVSYYDTEDRANQIRRNEIVYSERGERQTVTYSDPCIPVRLVVIEFDNAAPNFEAAQRGDLHNIRFEDGIVFGGRLLFVTKLWCAVRRFLRAISGLLRLRR